MAEVLKRRLVWFGGFPAHYMGEFHRKLEGRHNDVFFIYVPLGRAGRAFEHEQVELPSRHLLLPKEHRWLVAWRWLCQMDPQAVLIAGNFPRVNLLAALWAGAHGRELYYLCDSNALDRRNLQRGYLKNLMLRWVIGRANKLLTIGTRNSEFYLSLLGKANLSRKLHPFPLPHVHTSFERLEPGTHDPFVFLVLGRLDHVKAVDRVIAAFGLLGPALQRKCRLLIAGDGAARTVLENQAAEMDLGAHIEFRGAVPSNLASAVYGESNAVIVASHDEPWGLVVNEALSAARPVIGPFWIGAFADLVIPGITGLVTSGNEPEELAEAMRKLLEDPVRARTMGLAGRAHVCERGWTIDGSLQAFSNLFEDRANSSIVHHGLDEKSAGEQ